VRSKSTRLGIIREIDEENQRLRKAVSDLTLDKLIKADGNLSDAKHEISNADFGELIEAKKSGIQRAIQVKTGMDFKRFAKSILLAQGDCDVFLRANTE